MVFDSNPAKEPSIPEIRGMVEQAANDGDNKKKYIAIAVVAIILIALLWLFVFIPPIMPPIEVDLCHNAVQDEGEIGVDCGGECGDCPEFIDPFYVQPVSVSDVAVNLAEDRIFVLDESRHRIMVYDSKRNHIANIGETREGNDKKGFVYTGGGNAEGELLFPAAIDIDSKGRLYIIDREKRIQVFSSDGRVLDVLRFEENILDTFPKMEDTPQVDGAGLSIAVAEDGKIFVSDELSSAAAVFSSELKLIKAIGGRGSGKTNLVFPRQISLHDGLVYIADSGNSRIQVFDTELEYQSSISEGLEQPAAVAVGEDGKIYVADAWDNKIKVFDSAHNLKREVGGIGSIRGLFYDPYRIKLDSEGKLYVVETGNARLQILDKELETVMSIEGISGGSLTSFSPFYVAIGPEKQIVVSEPLNHRITMFSSTGKYVKELGGRGFSNTEFNVPKGLAFDSQGRLFVGDSQNHRIQVFSKNFDYIATIKHAELFWPVAVHVAPNGTIFVGEDSSKKVLMFDDKGEYLGAIGEEKGITLPLGVIATDDRIYITDDKAKTIEVFDLQLNKIESIGDVDARRNLSGEFNESFALDGEGNLLFADNTNRKVIVYDFETEEFSHFGEFGDFPGYALSVLEVAASNDGKIIAVADMVKHRVFLFDENQEKVGEITIKAFPRQN